MARLLFEISKKMKMKRSQMRGSQSLRLNAK
jgi:hypothetical protein